MKCAIIRISSKRSPLERFFAFAKRVCRAGHDILPAVYMLMPVSADNSGYSTPANCSDTAYGDAKCIFELAANHWHLMTASLLPIQPLLQHWLYYISAKKRLERSIAQILAF